MKNDNRPVVDRPDSDRWAEYFKDEWEWLTPKEKATCLSYRNQLGQKETPSLALIEKMNAIHEKNPDFHVVHIPSVPVAMIQDFSAYESLELV